MANKREHNPVRKAGPTIRFIGNEKFSLQPSTPDNIKDAIALALPTGLALVISSQNQNDDDRNAFRGIENTISMAGIIRPHALELKDSWRILAGALEQHPQDQFFQQRLAAFMLADILNHQHSLPTEEKAYAVKMRGELKKDYRRGVGLLINQIAQAIPIDEETRDIHARVVKDMEDFAQEVEHRIAHQPTSKEEAKDKFTFLNMFGKARASSLYKGWFTYGGRDDIQWLSFRTGNAITEEVVLAHSALSQELLQDGELEEFDPRLREIAWAAWFINNPSERPAQTAYFFDHPDMQKEFWDLFSVFPVREQGDAIFRDMLLFNDQATQRFLETIPIEDCHPEKQTWIVKGLIANHAVIKTDLPDHANNDQITREIERIAEKAGLKSAFARELSILNDSIPGVLVARDYELVSRAVRHQPKEEFIATIPEEQAILYVSRAAWPTRESFEETGEHQEVVASITKTEFYARWGEVAVVNLNDQDAIVTDSDKQLLRANGKVSDLLTTITETARSEGNNRPLIILPAFLPEGSPIAALKHAGVIGIEQRGKTVDIILDMQGQRLSLPRPLNRHGEIDGSDKSHFLSSINAALRLARTPFTDPALDKRDTTEIRSFVKGWNVKAQRENLPQLVFDEDPRARHKATPQTIFYVGKKPVVLGVLPVK